MKCEEELRIQLAKEISELWLECRMRCDRIEEITKQIKELKKERF